MIEKKFIHLLLKIMNIKLEKYNISKRRAIDNNEQQKSR